MHVKSIFYAIASLHWAGWFYVNLTQALVIQEGLLIEKMVLYDWPVGKSAVHFNN